MTGNVLPSSSLPRTLVMACTEALPPKEVDEKFVKFSFPFGNTSLPLSPRSLIFRTLSSPFKT